MLVGIGSHTTSAFVRSRSPIEIRYGCLHCPPVNPGSGHRIAVRETITPNYRGFPALQSAIDPRGQEQAKVQEACLLLRKRSIFEVREEVRCLRRNRICIDVRQIVSMSAEDHSVQMQQSGCWDGRVSRLVRRSVSSTTMFVTTNHRCRTAVFFISVSLGLRGAV